MLRTLECNVWISDFQVVAVTTNGTINNRRQLVMGHGIAHQVALRYPEVPLLLAKLVRKFGNKVYEIGKYEKRILYSFPVKHAWYEKADLELIARSYIELLNELVLYSGLDKYTRKVAIPCPGCDNGKRTWEEVSEVLEKVNDFFKDKNLLKTIYFVKYKEQEAQF